MLTRTVRLQLLIFAIVAIITVLVASLSYAKLPRLIGIGQYRVHVLFSDASGLYPRALVTENGVDVGLVKSITLTPTAADVTLSIDDSRHIPSDAFAAIHSTSAIGEQYVDFTATRSTGPYLRDGSVVPTERAAALPSSATLLDSVDDLLKSIPGPTLARVLTETSTAFTGTGIDLRELISSSSSLLDTAQANLAPTIRLLRIVEPFLSTQLDLVGQTSSYVRNLVGFTDQLVKSNADVGAVLDDVPPFTAQADAVTSDLSPTLPTLLANLTTVGGVLRTYLPNLQQTLVLVPPTFSAFLSAASTPEDLANHEGNLSFKFNLLDPGICVNGYLPESQYQPTSAVTSIATPQGLYCRPTDPGMGVRTAHNEPCAGLPGIRGATPEVCDEKAGRRSTITPPASIDIPASVADGSDPNARPGTTGTNPSGTSGTAATTAAPAPGSAAEQANSVAVPYDPATGAFQGPNGTFYILGGDNATSGAPTTWQQLLISTLGGS